MAENQRVEPRLSQYIHHKAARLGYPCAGTFELTPRCNFQCKMCYIHLSKQEQERRGRELTAEEWISLGEQACAEGMVFLLLTGGEPTLRPDFPRIYTALKKLGLMISINSNGYLLQGELLRLLQNDPPYRINISLYGTSNETYERLCGIPAYDTILQNIHALRDSGIDVKLNMSLTDYNRSDMEAVYRQAKALGVHTQAAAYMFPPVRVTGRFGCGDRMSPEDAAACEIAYDRLRFTPEQYAMRVKAIANGTRAPASDDCEGQPGAEMQCRAGRSSFWLSWDGKLMPCGMLPEPSADVRKLGFRAAWQSIHAAVGQIRLAQACTTCDYRHFCHACAAIAYCETGHHDGKPAYLCQMMQSLFKRYAAEANMIGGDL